MRRENNTNISLIIKYLKEAFIINEYRQEIVAQNCDRKKKRFHVCLFDCIEKNLSEKVVESFDAKKIKCLKVSIIGRGNNFFFFGLRTQYNILYFLFK